MSDELLKGNFKVKRKIQLDEKEQDQSLKEEFKEKALGNIGGSMIYMDSENVTWEGEE